MTLLRPVLTRRHSLLRRVHVHAFLAPLAFLFLATVCPVQAQDGTLDPTFGTGGLVTSGVIGAANEVLIASDDRVLVAGAFGGHFSVARFTADGVLDATFGTGGRVTTEFPGGGVAHSMVLLPDGKILAVGTSNGDFALARYTADGVLDAAFGVGGTVTTDFGFTDTAVAVGLQPGGLIVAAGSSSGRFALARYSADGVLDATFGTGGRVTTNVNGNGTSIAYDMAIYSDGRIIAVGDVRNSSNSFRDWALARYTADGALDPTFGSGGLVLDRIVIFTDNALRAVALDASERIVVAGNYFDPGSDDIIEAVTLRYTTSGARDPSFGSNGLAIQAVGSYDPCPGSQDFCDRVGWNAVAFQSDGKIVLAGYRGFLHIPAADFAVGRVLPSGERDEEFNPSNGRGIAHTSFGVTDEALAMALDSAGRIVVAGRADGTMALARYLSGSPPPPVACEPGFYSATGNAPCLPAPPGTFVDVAGATAATPCAPGSYQPDEGQTACLLAPPGYYVDVAGAVAAIACALGSYNGVSGAVACTLAEIGFYVDVVAAAAPIACPDGTTTLQTGSTSATDCVTPGGPPVADAGPDQTAVVGQTVALDGSGSTGALTYAWTLAPTGTLSDPSAVGPTFCAAAAGVYTATLVVNDGTVSSAPDAATITALTATAALDALAAEVAALRAAGVLSRAQAGALTNNLTSAKRHLARGHVPGALDVLAGFRRQALSLWQNDGVLTEAQAMALVASVDAIMGALAAPCTAAPAPLASATAGGPALVGLGVAYPNPARAGVTVPYGLAEAGFVRLAVYDALGREVAVLVDGPAEAGSHAAYLDGASLPSGVYLVRLTTGGGLAQTLRLTLVR